MGAHASFSLVCACTGTLAWLCDLMIHTSSYEERQGDFVVAVQANLRRLSKSGAFDDLCQGTKKRGDPVLARVTHVAVAIHRAPRRLLERIVTVQRQKLEVRQINQSLRHITCEGK